MPLVLLYQGYLPLRLKAGFRRLNKCTTVWLGTFDTVAGVESGTDEVSSATLFEPKISTGFENHFEQHDIFKNFVTLFETKLYYS